MESEKGASLIPENESQYQAKEKAQTAFKNKATIGSASHDQSHLEHGLYA